MHEHPRISFPNNQLDQAGEDPSAVTTSPASAKSLPDVKTSPDPAHDAIILDPEQLPRWQRPFVLKPNVRFTRTPGRARPEDVKPQDRPTANVGLTSGLTETAEAVSPARELQHRVEQAIVGTAAPVLDVRLKKEGSLARGASEHADAHAQAAAAAANFVEIEKQNVPDGLNREKLPEPAKANGRRSKEEQVARAIPDHLFWEMLSLGTLGLDLDKHQERQASAAFARPSTPPSVLTTPRQLQRIQAPEVTATRLEEGSSSHDAPAQLASPLAFYRQVEVRPQGAGSAVSRSLLSTPPGQRLEQHQPACSDNHDPHRVRTAASSGTDAFDYLFPSVDFLQPARAIPVGEMSQEALEKSAGLLESVLEDFGVKGDIIDVCPGPVVTLYEFAPAPGVKSSRIINLSDDIARSMSALSARVAVVPGRNVIGIELPNPQRETVYLRELFESESYISTDQRLPLCLGKTIGGEPVVADLARMPHLLVAGTTGSGKSVAINTMILSLLYHLRPDECRLIMIDPKMLELSVYDGIPHLLTPVVTDSKKAVLALKWAVREMEERYRKMSRLAVRNIDGFNQRVAEARSKGETIYVSVPCGFDRSTGEELLEQQELDLQPLPYIVVIVDEMADLMMVAGKEIEGAIQRLAQMARAAGIHLVMATQRPSVDVITGTIKANFPTRISFQVTSKIDSRTILGEQGAEHLLGQGDMLHMMGGGRICRVHGPFVSDYEVERVVAHLKAQGRPSYLCGVTEEADTETDEAEDAVVFDQTEAGEDGGADELYDRALKIVQRDNKCSTSYIQRRLSIGYNRAASLVERMEQEGLVGPPNHVGKREILGLKAQADPQA